MERQKGAHVDLLEEMAKAVIEGDEEEAFPWQKGPFHGDEPDGSH